MTFNPNGDKLLTIKDFIEILKTYPEDMLIAQGCDRGTVHVPKLEIENVLLYNKEDLDKLSREGRSEFGEIVFIKNQKESELIPILVIQDEW